MSRRQELKAHMELLAEIRDILAAMKNIALMETRKLSRFLATQRDVVATLEEAAGDFLHHHPRFMPTARSDQELLVLLGSERGFCGDFNAAVLRRLERHLDGADGREARLIVVGRRLAGKLAGDPRVVAEVPGPTVIEELDTALTQVVEAVYAQLQAIAAASPFALTVLYHQHRANGGTSAVRVFEPVTQFVSRPRRFVHPPRLLLPPEQFVAALIDRYISAVLHEVFYSSLMTENRRRLAQMQGALQRLERQLDEGRVKLNMLRQEEITEEIEVIMLSSEALRRRHGTSF